MSGLQEEWECYREREQTPRKHAQDLGLIALEILYGRTALLRQAEATFGSSKALRNVLDQAHLRRRTVQKTSSGRLVDLVVEEILKLLHDHKEALL